MTREHMYEHATDSSHNPRGKHRLYIGMAPGVGKTYRMLEEAQALKTEGIDVVIGLLETHGRQETAAAAVGLEQVPRLAIQRGTATFSEMDTEAILARQPQLALVDELAHTNVPGSTRQKRWEEVEILLKAGINVFSTVNIQHLDSLNDLVAKITGIVVRERVPDRILDEADEVVVVDVTPEILQERLREGRIYAPDKIEQSLQNFFQRKHLIALRELALREVADNLEETAEHEDHYCSIHERVMVCVSTRPNSSQLLRRGAHVASQMRAKFYALYVEPSDRFLSKDEVLHLERCEQFCRNFGGEFLRIKRADVAQAIADVAHEHHITQVVIGQTQRSRWELLLRGSPVLELLRYLKDVDLHVIATGSADR
jgi:two-component system, OmpR family, sensor histidine kinase KdpD